MKLVRKGCYFGVNEGKGRGKSHLSFGICPYYSMYYIWVNRTVQSLEVQWGNDSNQKPNFWLIETRLVKKFKYYFAPAKTSPKSGHLYKSQWLGTPTLCNSTLQQTRLTALFTGLRLECALRGLVSRNVKISFIRWCIGQDIQKMERVLRFYLVESCKPVLTGLFLGVL